MTLTWSEVSARLQSGEFCCWDYLSFHVLGWPCWRHCTLEERAEIDAEMLRRAQMPNPALAMLKNRDADVKHDEDSDGFAMWLPDRQHVVGCGWPGAMCTCKPFERLASREAKP